MRGKQVILKLKKEGKPVKGITQTMGVANTTIWIENVPEKKETIGVLSDRQLTGHAKENDR